MSINRSLLCRLRGERTNRVCGYQSLTQASYSFSFFLFSSIGQGWMGRDGRETNIHIDTLIEKRSGKISAKLSLFLCL